MSDPSQPQKSETQHLAEASIGRALGAVRPADEALLEPPSFDTARIVRGESSGVFFGFLVAHVGRTAILAYARRIGWTAQFRVTVEASENLQISEPIEKIRITDAVEIMDCDARDAERLALGESIEADRAYAYGLGG